jgi:hypothetical protein
MYHAPTNYTFPSQQLKHIVIVIPFNFEIFEPYTNNFVISMLYHISNNYDYTFLEILYDDIGSIMVHDYGDCFSVHTEMDRLIKHCTIVIRAISSYIEPYSNLINNSEFIEVIHSIANSTALVIHYE